MANKVTLTPFFENRYNRLAKKFVSLENEVDGLINDLTKTPAIGEPLGAGLFKVRLAVKNKGKGKSGGFRVITYLVTEADDEAEIFLITIYDKSEEVTIKKPLLLKMVKTLLGE